MLPPCCAVFWGSVRGYLVCVCVCVCVRVPCPAAAPGGSKRGPGGGLVWSVPGELVRSDGNTTWLRPCVMICLSCSDDLKRSQDLRGAPQSRALEPERLSYSEQVTDRTSGREEQVNGILTGSENKCLWASHRGSVRSNSGTAFTVSDLIYLQDRWVTRERSLRENNPNVVLVPLSNKEFYYIEIIQDCATQEKSLNSSDRIQLFSYSNSVKRGVLLTWGMSHVSKFKFQVYLCRASHEKLQFSGLHK